MNAMFLYRASSHRLVARILLMSLWTAGSACSAGSAYEAGTYEEQLNSPAGQDAAADADVIVADNQATTNVPLDFGKNVFVFDPSMSKADIQRKLDATFNQQASNQFGSERFAYLFKPGTYQNDINLGFYMTAAGLGRSPDDVDITGAVRSKATWFNGNATQNFWRGAENMAVTPTQDNGINIWAVSQATTFRRMHVKGKMKLDDGGYSSGGFIADSVFDISLDSGTQQQFLTRNSDLSLWVGGSWNMVFVGDKNAPTSRWPSNSYSVIGQTDLLREKPFLALNDQGNYIVVIPTLKRNSQGASWRGATSSDEAVTLTINHFYIAHADTDSASSINQALARGLNVLFTPGVYRLDSAIHVTRDNTTLLGIGLATLTAESGTAALQIDDLSGVSVAGLLLDAGAEQSSSLLVVGTPGASASHSTNPTVLFDVSCRVGGAAIAQTKSCVTIHSNDVLIDNIWIWRADHGNGVGWDTNPSENGITVNGDNVTAYGLFVEHFEGVQTLWNGEGGRVYFYQSEIPYDVPDQKSWQQGSKRGFASYKVADTVKTHTAIGMGVYCVFTNSVVLDNAIETPTKAGIVLSHLITQWLGKAAGSSIAHIINGKGNAVSASNRQAKSDT